LLESATEPADQMALKAALANYYARQLREGSYLTRKGKTVAVVCTDASRVASVPVVAKYLDCRFAAPIADRVAALAAGGVAGSSDETQPIKTTIDLMLDARAKAQAKIQNHPIQQVLDVREWVEENNSLWTAPLVTSYGSPCAVQVSALLGELSQAATSDTDRQALREAVGKRLASIYTGSVLNFREALGDVAHQQSDQAGVTASKLARGNCLGKVLDRLFPEQIGRYVAAHIAAAGDGSAPSVVIGGRVELLVKARADHKLKDAKNGAWNGANPAKRQPERAAKAQHLVDARERISARLRTQAPAENHRQAAQDLADHVPFASREERDSVFATLDYAKNRKNNPECEPGTEFMHGWPLSKDASVALDQAILHERSTKSMPAAPADTQPSKD
jgi:hypothetical protein